MGRIGRGRWGNWVGVKLAWATNVIERPKRHIHAMDAASTAPEVHCDAGKTSAWSNEHTGPTPALCAPTKLTRLSVRRCGAHASSGALSRESESGTTEKAIRAIELMSCERRLRLSMRVAARGVASTWARLIEMVIKAADAEVRRMRSK